MKEKDFEVIVPAYDALEAELEDILGGKASTNSSDSGLKTCADWGEVPSPKKPCCPGLIAEVHPRLGVVCMYKI